MLAVLGRASRAATAIDGSPGERQVKCERKRAAEASMTLPHILVAAYQPGARERKAREDTSRNSSSIKLLKPVRCHHILRSPANAKRTALITEAQSAAVCEVICVAISEAVHEAVCEGTSAAICAAICAAQSRPFSNFLRHQKTRLSRREHSRLEWGANLARSPASMAAQMAAEVASEVTTEAASLVTAKVASEAAAQTATEVGVAVTPGRSKALGNWDANASASRSP